MINLGHKHILLLLLYSHINTFFGYLRIINFTRSILLRISPARIYLSVHSYAFKDIRFALINCCIPNRNSFNTTCYSITLKTAKYSFIFFLTAVTAKRIHKTLHICSCTYYTFSRALDPF